MSDDKSQNPLSRYTGESDVDTDGVIGNPCYGFMKIAGTHRAMLEFRFKKGPETALPYSYISRVELFDEGTMTIYFVGDTIKIEGQRIRDLYRMVVSQRLAYIAELKPGEETKDKAPVVESITPVQLKAESA